MDAATTIKASQTFLSPSNYLLSCCVVTLLIHGSGLVAQTSEPTGPQDQSAVELESAEAPAQTEENQRGCGCCRNAKGPGRGAGTSQGAGCGKGQGRGGAKGNEGRRSAHAGRPEMQLAHFLVDNHESIQRQVEMIADGVRTRTTATDPDLVDSLREHVRQMAALIEGGGRIRNWDPLFREIFDHRESIEIRIDDLEDGVEVVETSPDDAVALLIQAHARKVDEFVARGRAAYREETPLPAGYSNTRP